MDMVGERLEEWRLTIPERFRPGGTSSVHQASQLSGTWIRLVAVHIQYLYFSIRTVLERLHIRFGAEEAEQSETRKLNLLQSTQAVVELTRFIDIEPHVPLLYVF